jgi:hypothetical protein
MRERACSFERRIGSIDACQSSKLDLPRRVGILRWVAFDSSGAMVEGIVDAGKVGASSGAVRWGNSDAGEENVDMFAASQ